MRFLWVLMVSSVSCGFWWESASFWWLLIGSGCSGGILVSYDFLWILVAPGRFWLVLVVLLGFCWVLMGFLWFLVGSAGRVLVACGSFWRFLGSKLR